MQQQPPIMQQHPPTKPGLRQRLHDAIHRHPRRTIVVVTLSLLIVAIFGSLALLYQPPQKMPDEVKEQPAPKPVAKRFYTPLNGQEVGTEAATRKPVTAVIIENTPDARPQSGLKEAEVIYEAIAEGGITRFLALYQQNKPELVGPVRSLRTYYVDWLAPYQPSVAHVGGSKAALDEIRNGSYRDLDQMLYGGTYWRATDRYAPHNVYTSFERLDALGNEKGYSESVFTSFGRVDGAASEAPNATVLDLAFGSATYNTHYDYDAATNSYVRSQGGAPHTDREKGHIAPAVVVAMSVDMTRVMEDGYRESINTIGSGPATVFQNGTVTEGTWRKTDRTTPLELLDANGQPISLVRGQTWISAIPNGRGAITWQ